MLKYLAFILVISCISCSKQNPEIVRGFYHWQTSFNVTDTQNKTLINLEVKNLYVKYFDVKWVNGEAKPVAEVIWETPTDQNIIPVVYITTEVFSEMNTTKIPDLALKVSRKIKNLQKSLSEKNLKIKRFEEIQIDCDWTPSIKDKYFFFLEQIQKHFDGVSLSVTVRLYQYKYPNIAGIPPVKKGLLMYYNMGELFDQHEVNSILNNDVGKQYLGFNNYPLPMDLALPNFSWSLIFVNNEFDHISKAFGTENFEDTALFHKLQNDNFSIKKDTVIRGNYYRMGDKLRYETCSTDELLKAVELLKPEINQKKTNVIIYDLNADLNQDYEKINTVFNAFN